MIDARLIELGRLVTGRPESLFKGDYHRHFDSLRKAFSGRRILVVGAAGSIGSSTLRCLLEWEPAETLLVDIAENNLVELLRSIRSDANLAQSHVAIQPVDYGSPIMERILQTHLPFDWVFNFAAAKHVRSERDVPSLLQMMDTNLLKADRFLGWLRKYGHGNEGVFFVSSDKAANPTNLMGASKRMMEQLLFWHASSDSAGSTLLGASCDGGPLRCTTARFANVAFSDGSLLQGFLNRIAKHQPLAGPSDIRRYFVTLEESGHICTLASLLARPGEVLIPALDELSDLKDFREIAELVLRFYGHEPNWCTSDHEAQAAVVQDGRWPCWFSPGDSMGEKPFEEFVGKGEHVREIGCQSVRIVRPASLPPTSELEAMFHRLLGWVEHPDETVTKEAILACVKKVVPTLSHANSQKSLDARM